MGNKNDYVTLEDSARKLGISVSLLKSVINDKKITLRITRKGQSIRLRDLEKLREDIPSVTEKIVKGLLPEKSANRQKATASRSTDIRSSNKISGSKGPTKPALTKNSKSPKDRDKPAILKQIADLDFRIDVMSIDLRQRIDNYRANLETGRSPKRSKPPTALLKEWEESIRRLNRLLEKAKVAGLTVRTNWGGFKLPPPRQTKATRPRVAGAPSANPTPRGPGGKGSTEKRKISPEELKELQARTAASVKQARMWSSGSPIKKRTERRYWWNEED